MGRNDNFFTCIFFFFLFLKLLLLIGEREWGEGGEKKKAGRLLDTANLFIKTKGVGFREVLAKSVAQRVEG